MRLNRWRGVEIGKNVWIGYDVILETSCPQLVTIRDGAAIESDRHGGERDYQINSAENDGARKSSRTNRHGRNPIHARRVNEGGPKRSSTSSPVAREIGLAVKFSRAGRPMLRSDPSDSAGVGSAGL